ncbi:hypothetical protein C8F01DRAFT_637043 [Mycena amicta]|nr:hypothetical protein C8F01DRAFT_637043 [Mycena amicta]
MTSSRPRPRPPSNELPMPSAYTHLLSAITFATCLPLHPQTMSSSTITVARTILLTRRRCVKQTPSSADASVTQPSYRSGPQCCHCGCRGTHTTTCPFNPATCTWFVREHPKLACQTNAAYLLDPRRCCLPSLTTGSNAHIVSLYLSHANILV